MVRDVGDPVMQLAERVAACQPELDALTQQRILARVRARVASEPHRSRVSPAWIGLCAVACALLITWLWPRPGSDQPLTQRASAPTAESAPAALDHGAQTAALAAQTPTPPTLVPYLVAGSDAARAHALLGQQVESLTLSAGERVLASLAGRARLLLLGPARLSLRSASAARVELSLEQGTLLGDYDHAQGGELIIQTRNARTEIVGTLFSIQVEGEQARVAVAHGVVRVQTGDASHLLHASQALLAGAPTPSALAVTDATALRQHERSLLPPVGDDYGTLSVTGEGLEVEVAGRLLGSAPVWALLPAGANNVVVHRGGARHELPSLVRAREQTELTLARRRESVPMRGAAPSSDALYEAAEQAMRQGDSLRATKLLSELVEAHPRAGSVDLALYELAQLAYQRADYGVAHGWLSRLEAQGPRAALREPAHALRCRVAKARGDEVGLDGCP